MIVVDPSFIDMRVLMIQPKVLSGPIPSKFQPELRLQLCPRGEEASKQSAAPGRIIIPFLAIPTVLTMRACSPLMRLSVTQNIIVCGLIL